MKRTVVFVVKDVFTTRFMQDAGMFEPFKFVGKLLEAKQAPTHHHLTAQEMLEKTPGDENFAVVGVIIPNVDAAFLPKHTVCSSGKGWITIENLCKHYNVEMKLPCT